jgi:hypothetical protein
MGGDSAHPWLTPNHPLNCGDVILAQPGAYTSSNFNGNFGPVSCPNANDVAWLKCENFLTCTIDAGGSNGMALTTPYWGIQGWQVNNASSCFVISPDFGASQPTHHVILANNVASHCSGNGLSINSGVGFGVDYFAIVGNWVYNSATTTSDCYAAISIYEAVNYDSAPGTHIYIAGNLVNDTLNSLCNNGHTYGGDGIVFDTFDGFGNAAVMQPHPYTGQSLVDNNILLFNGGSGWDQYDNSAHPPNGVQIVRHNTAYGNMFDPNAYDLGSCAQLRMRKDAEGSSNTTIEYNIADSTQATGCSGNTLYDIFAADTLGAPGSTVVTNNWGYTASHQYFTQSLADTNNASGVVVVSNELTGVSPGFANPVDPGQPSCSGHASVPDCMSSVAANFKPSGNAVSYGYQAPSSTPVHDDLFPQWMCSVTSFPPGLVTMGCL